jgi:hypothetical protein
MPLGVKSWLLPFFMFILGLLLTAHRVDAQDSLLASQLLETKWRYTYALHLESNTIIHQAENFYDFYLYFRYDFTYEQYLNTQISKGTWSIGEGTLFYSFKNINKFHIAELTKNKLVLEFTQPNAKGTYQYHFLRVETKDAPFVRPANVLPEVNVVSVDTRKKDKNHWYTQSPRKRTKDQTTAEKQTYISIELIGGGYYGGIDPVLRDFIQIKTDGRLINEFKSLNRGLYVTKKDIPRAELEKFAEWVTAQGFFDMQRMYDCETPICQKRKQLKPTPIPLRLAIAYGSRRKVITISIWGMDENNIHYVDYPRALDHIIETIQKMAHRSDDPMVKK